MSSIDKVNKILAQKGLTGADLSRMIGASRGAYSNWNRGKSKISKISLYKIAAALDVPVNTLLDDEGEETQDVEKTHSLSEDEEILEIIKENPGMRVLCKKARYATPEQLFAIGQMIESFKQGG